MEVVAEIEQLPVKDIPNTSMPADSSNGMSQDERDISAEDKVMHGIKESTVRRPRSAIDASDEVTNSVEQQSMLDIEKSAFIMIDLAENSRSNTLTSSLKDDPEEDNHTDQRKNYKKASLLVQEGANNEKFDSRPNGIFSNMAFDLIHHPVFYTAEFIICCLLLALAIIEEPYLINIIEGNKAAVTVVNSSLEIGLLFLIAGSIVLRRLIWMKPKTFLRQRITIVVVIMIIMFIEALVVLIRRENHFRITRCLRPIFFIDSFLMAGVKRVLRQIAQCIFAIIDVFLLLLLMVAIFSFAAYYLFSEIDPVYFDNFFKSFLSIFIGLTTANHPDVFMSAYVYNRASALFFVLYLFVTLFFLMNVLLGVVFANFSAKDMEKFKELYLHKREALRNAYFVLVTHSRGVSFQDFLLFMREYKPRTPEYQVMCIFKALQSDADPQEYLCLEEFYNFYKMQNLHWQQIKKGTEVYSWYENFPKIINKIFKGIHNIERFRGFDYIMTIVILLNAAYLMIFAIVTSYYCGEDQAGDAGISFRDKLQKYCYGDRFKASRDSLIGSFVFTGIYLIEILIRLLALGPYEYFRKKWNIYDSTVLFISLICLIIEATIPSLGILVIFRPVKLFRIVKLKKRYYILMSAVTYLRGRLLSVLLLLFVIFYFYAIIGMEVFRGSVYVGCCYYYSEDAYYGIDVYYSGNATQPSPQSYWLNNFDNIYQSYITLYEQMVVNNWFIQMEGFVSETTIYARFYFVSFWMTTTVCLSVVIAYIVDAFMISHEAHVSKYQDQQKCDNHTWFKCNCVRIRRKKNIMARFTKDEVKRRIEEIDQQVASKESEKCSINRLLRRFYSQRIELHEDEDIDVVKFIGKGLQTKEYINLEKYKNELKDWIEENEKFRKEKKNKRRERERLEKNMSTGKRLCQLLTKALKAAARYIVE